jgi:hypothetical protein
MAINIITYLKFINQIAMKRIPVKYKKPEAVEREAITLVSEGI